VCDRMLVGFIIYIMQYPKRVVIGTTLCYL